MEPLRNMIHRKWQILPQKIFPHLVSQSFYIPYLRFYFILFFLKIGVELGNASRWKESLAERAHSRQSVNLMQLVYGKTASKSTTAEMEQISEDDESEDDEFFKPKGEGKKVCVKWN